MTNLPRATNLIHLISNACCNAYCNTCCNTLESKVLPAFQQDYFAEHIQSVKNCLADCKEMAEKDPEQLIKLLKDIFE